MNPEIILIFLTCLTCLIALTTLITPKIFPHYTKKAPEPKNTVFSEIKKTVVLTSLKIFRHGARVPKGKPLKDWYIKEGYTYSKQLTKLGKKQNEKLGLKYLLKDSQILHDDSVVFSSPYQRCIDSAHSFLKSYFKFEKKKIHFFENPRVLKLPTVEKYHQFSRDYLIQVTKDYSEEIDRLYDQAVHNGLVELMETHYGKCKIFPESAKDKIQNLKKMNSTYYCNFMNKLHYHDFKEPIIKVLRKGAKLLYFLKFGQKNYSLYYSREIFKILGNQILISLSKNIDFKNKSSLKKFYRFKNNYKSAKNIFLFAHNKNIMALLFSLFDHQYLYDTELMMVKFVADLSFQLIQEGNNFFVQILFMDKELFLKESRNTRCDYKTFLNVIDNKLKNLKKDEPEDFKDYDSSPVDDLISAASQKSKLNFIYRIKNFFKRMF